MKGLREKFRKNEGFTMVELLIVVAIIAILVAVSIPMMNSALEKSRHAVDRANIRDAVALASVKYLSDPKSFKDEQSFYYCVDPNHQGYLGDGSSDEDERLKCECTCSGTDRPGDTDYLIVSIQAPTTADDDTPAIKLSWSFTEADGTKKVATADAPATPTTPVGP